MASLTDLPTELLENILKYVSSKDLCRFARTKRQLASLSVRLLYRNVVPADTDKLLLLIDMLKLSAKRCSYIRYLSLVNLTVDDELDNDGNSTDTLEEALQFLMSYCTNVVYLRLPICSMGGTMMLTAVGSKNSAFPLLPSLRMLDLSGCRYFPRGLLSYFLQAFPRLTGIKASGTHVIDYSLLLTMGVHLTQLDTLHLDASADLTEEGFNVLVMGCRLLCRLHIELPPGIAYTNRLTDPIVKLLATHYPSMVELTLAGQARLSDEGVTALADGCRHLKKLSLFNCRRVTRVGVRNLLQQCPSLTHFILDGTAVVQDVWLAEQVQQRYLQTRASVSVINTYDMWSFRGRKELTWLYSRL
ncbi:hypothetical protein BDF22DRAFT_740477 [Syncephalis plumigaleata]|nr:hypothetical protein BDF22DRAFT_740477 [Syncephalis plumigaleata]